MRRGAAAPWLAAALAGLAVAQAAAAAPASAPVSASASAPASGAAPAFVALPSTCAGPEYPREAVRYELEGVTTLRFRLAPGGRVGQVAVASSSGWAMLDDAAIRTLQACAFPPAQAARAAGAALPVRYVWNLDGEHSLRPHLVPGSCPASGRFAAFLAYDGKPSGPDGVKVRLLVDPAGRPRGIRAEGAALAPAAAAALVGYVQGCRFGFDPALNGPRTDTVYGRVVLR